MEEMMMNENLTIEEVNTDAIPDNSGSGIVGKVIIGLGAAAVVGTIAWLRKNRNKLTERQIAKLEKKGYVVHKPESTEGEVESNFVDESK